MGSDIQKGQAVLQAGELIGPAEVGILATVGAAKLKVNTYQGKELLLPPPISINASMSGQLCGGRRLQKNRQK